MSRSGYGDNIKMFPNYLLLRVIDITEFRVSFDQTSIYVQPHKDVAEILILKILSLPPRSRCLLESEVRPTLTISLSELALSAALSLHSLLVQEIFHLHVAALPRFFPQLLLILQLFGRPPTRHLFRNRF